MIRIDHKMDGPVGSPWYNSLYFFGVTQADATAAANAAGTFWATLAQAISNGVFVRLEPEAQRINPITGQVMEVYPVSRPAIASSGGASPLPVQTQGLIRVKTSVYILGRRLQGRVFVPWPVEAVNVDPGVPTLDYITKLQTAINGLLPGGGLGNELAVYSRTAGVHHPATSGVPSAKWSYLRSRRD